MELAIFARFHAREGEEDKVANAIREVIVPSRAEPGCLLIAAYLSTRDPRQFFVYSRWINDAAFDAHAEMPHTIAFVLHVQQLIDHPMDVSRAHQIA